MIRWMVRKPVVLLYQGPLLQCMSPLYGGGWKQPKAGAVMFKANIPKRCCIRLACRRRTAIEGSWQYLAAVYMPGSAKTIRQMLKKADNIQEFLNFCARLETMQYPCSAKYFLNRFGGVRMEHLSRNTDCQLLTDDHKSFISLLNVVAHDVYSYLSIS